MNVTIRIMIILNLGPKPNLFPFGPFIREMFYALQKTDTYN